VIDVDFIFQIELNKGKPREKWLDADRYSKELQSTHQTLWSKPLNSGQIFTLEKKAANRLIHKSDLGEFILSSDRAVPSFFNKVKWLKQYPYLNSLPSEITQSFWNLSETIGGMAIWPATKNGGNTINQNRCFGNNQTVIADRLDLTIECIRRYYIGVESPLSETFNRYKSFFDLFGTFKNYVEFFLFQDWVDRKSVV
jgi:hypothetical protein